MDIISDVFNDNQNQFYRIKRTINTGFKMIFKDNMEYKDYILHAFANESYLKRKAKQIVTKDTTNDWGFNGTKSTKYIFENGSSYEFGSENLYGRFHKSFYIYRVGKKECTKDEFLKLNKIRRETSIKLWKQPCYDGKFDSLINDYINNTL